MVHKLETCIGNRAFGSQDLLSRAALAWHETEVHTMEWGCLGNCHRCYRTPFALLDEYTLLEAPTTDELWSLVQAYMSERL